MSDPFFLEAEGDELSLSKRIQLRWRVAFRAICFIRILSLNKKVPDKNSQFLSHSPSHVAIHIQNPTTDRQQEQRFRDVDENPLSKMVKEKSFASLRRFGGVEGVAAILQSSDPENGVRDKEADLEQRRNVFGANKYAQQSSKSFLSCIPEALKDTTIIILVCCGLLSLGFDIKQKGKENGWYDGASIIVAVFLVVIVSAVRNFKQDRLFDSHFNESRDITVEVVRDGRSRRYSIVNIVVGDVVPLRIGDTILADGLFLEGHSMMVDESSLTGESGFVEINEENPFLLAGTKVVDGYGVMLVTCVGMKTTWGELMSALRNEFISEQTSLQVRLKWLASFIGKIGFAMAVVVRVVKLILYLTGEAKDEMGNRGFVWEEMMVSLVRKMAKEVTVLVVAIPRSLPQAVSLALAFSMMRMKKDHVSVRRCVYNNIHKLIQFQLTVNVAALVLNFVASLSSGEVPLTAVQLLWVNLIMDTLGALALATRPPTDDLMKRPPVERTLPLITRTMWRNLIPQVVFQVAVLLTLQFLGRSIFQVAEGVKRTMIFNTFVFCQVFNMFNCRNLEKKNIFERIHKNKLFLAIIGISIGIQIAMVEFVNTFAHTERLNCMQWAVSIGIAALSWLIGVLFKCIAV